MSALSGRRESQAVSLTATVKEELARIQVTKRQTRVAELSSVLRFSGGLARIGNRLAVESEVETKQIAQRIQRDLIDLFGVRPDVSVIAPGGTKRTVTYLVRVLEGETLARQTGLLDARQRPTRGLPAALVTGSLDDAAAVWRGAFLASGALTDPGRSSALEVNCPAAEAGMALLGAARRLGVAGRAREVRGAHRVEVRDGEAIGTLLEAMGALVALGTWEELRQKRDVRQSANRLVNFDDANLRRSARAAVIQGARVARALEILGDLVPANLAEAGRLRLEHPAASLSELGALSGASKDAIAGQIRRLCLMADRRAQELGVPDTSADLPEDIDD